MNKQAEETIYMPLKGAPSKQIELRTDTRQTE